MVYIPRYGWYIMLGLSLLPKQREVFEVKFSNWCDKLKKVVLREKSDIGLWIQTWSNLEKMTITPTYFISVRVSLLKRLQASGTQLCLKRLWHRCFSMSFAKFLRTPFLQNNCGCLLLIQVVSSPNPIIKYIIVIQIRSSSFFKSRAVKYVISVIINSCSKDLQSKSSKM